MPGKATTPRRIAHVCPICGTSFSRYLSDNPPTAKVYCSRRCYGVAQRGPNYRPPQPPRPRRTLTGTCAICGKSFVYRADRNQRTCSIPCCALLKRSAPLKAQRWSARYRAWRMAVLRRDGFRCCQCGASGVTLESHHIKSWARFPALRFDVDNGVTLCQPCHDALHSAYIHVYRAK